MSARYYCNLRQERLAQHFDLSLVRYRIGGPEAPQTSLLPWGREGLPRPGGKARKRALSERRGIMKLKSRGIWSPITHVQSLHTCPDRPIPKCKTSIVVTATIIALFKANTEDTTEEVARAAEGRATSFVLTAFSPFAPPGTHGGLVYASPNKKNNFCSS